MIKPSASLLFPFRNDNENDCFKRAHTIEDTLLSAIRCFLITRRGSRLGSNIGSFLPELLMQNIPASKLPALSNELRSELTEQFPGVQFISVSLVRDLSNHVSEVIVKISFTTSMQENISELTMALPSVFSTDFEIEK